MVELLAAPLLRATGTPKFWPVIWNWTDPVGVALPEVGLTVAVGEAAFVVLVQLLVMLLKLPVWVETVWMAWFVTDRVLIALLLATPLDSVTGTPRLLPS